MQFTFSIVALFAVMGLTMAAPAPQGTPIGCVETFNACEAAANGDANAITQCSLALASCESGTP